MGEAIGPSGGSSEGYEGAGETRELDARGPKRHELASTARGPKRHEPRGGDKRARGLAKRGDSSGLAKGLRPPTKRVKGPSEGRTRIGPSEGRAGSERARLVRVRPLLRTSRACSGPSHQPPPPTPSDESRAIGPSGDSLDWSERSLTVTSEGPSEGRTSRVRARHGNERAQRARGLVGRARI
jgi:hypothetical protein